MRGPKAGNALQEVCVHEVGNRGGFVWARRWNYIVFFVFFLGCRACAWTGTAPGVLGRPSHPPSSYHPKGGLIGILWYRFESLYTAAAIMRKPQLLRARIPPWRQLPAPPAPPAPIYVRPRIAEQPPWRQSPKSKPPAHLPAPRVVPFKIAEPLHRASEKRQPAPPELPPPEHLLAPKEWFYTPGVDAE